MAPDRVSLRDIGRLQDDLEWRRLRSRLWELKLSRGKHLLSRTCISILMHVKFWPLRMPNLLEPTEGKSGKRDTRMNRQCFKIHYDACWWRGLLWMFSDHCASFEINCWVHIGCVDLSKVMSCISSNPDFIMTSCQLSHRASGFLKTLCPYLFESWRHYDWDHRVL